MRNIKEIIIGLIAVAYLLTGCDSKETENRKPEAEASDYSIRLAKLTLSNPEMQASIADYIRSDAELNGNRSKVYQVFLENYYTELSYKITSIIYYSSLVERLPIGYTTIEAKVVVFYTGLEKLAEPDSSLIKDLMNVIGDDLENDLLEDNKTLNPDFRPGTYSPSTWEVVVNEDSVGINRVASPPELIKIPIVEIPKFLPPKK